MKYQHYLISLNPVTNQYELLGTDTIYFESVYDVEKLADNLDPDKIRAALFQLLNEEKILEGHEKATGS